MDRNSFETHWRQLLTADGRMKPDERFRIRYVAGPTGGDSGFIEITFVDDNAQAAVTYHASSTPDAMSWMVNRPPPSGSMRLGNVVSRITQALSIPSCNSCKSRQLKLNQFGRK